MPPWPHHPWWSQVVPMPKDSLPEHAGAVPPRSKAQRGLPQVHTPRGRALLGRPRGDPEQHPAEHPGIACHPHPRHCRSGAGCVCRPQCTHRPGRGKTPQDSGVSLCGKKKKSSSQHQRRCPSLEKEPAPQRGPWHPCYSHTTAGEGISSNSRRSSSWPYPHEQGSTVVHRCVCKKSWVSGHFQLSTGSARSPSHSPPQCPASPVPPLNRNNHSHFPGSGHGCKKHRLLATPKAQ